MPIIQSTGMKSVLLSVMRSLRAKMSKKTGEPIEVVLQCHRGVHRSVAVAFALYTIWRLIDGVVVEFRHASLRACACRLVCQTCRERAKRAAPLGGDGGRSAEEEKP